MKYWAKPLQLLYKDPRRWTYNFQKAVWMHYFKVQRQIALLTDSKNESALKVIIIERDPHSAVEVFCKCAQKLQNLNQKQLDVLTHEFNKIQIHIDATFFLNASIETSKRRIYLRQRKCERNIDDQYLQFIQQQYENLYKKQNNVFTLEASKSVNDLESLAVKIIFDLINKKLSNQQF